jgi:hypothetical protein
MSTRAQPPKLMTCAMLGCACTKDAWHLDRAQIVRWRDYLHYKHRLLAGAVPHSRPLAHFHGEEGGGGWGCIGIVPRVGLGAHLYGEASLRSFR